ncbi:transcriptional regulator/sugar kinase [Opitutaceae bacterium TAV1]|nr:transcriptional regulator/sugar kinase [Opitutaceae bacterium TAV1]
MSRSESPPSLEDKMLKLIRAGASQSRIRLARALHVSPATASTYVDRLIVAGFVIESRSAGTVAGRPPVHLELNPGAGEFIGIDFEASRILAVALDFAHRLVRSSEQRIDPGDTPAAIIAKIARATEDVQPPAGAPLLGIGIGVPGFVDQEKGISISWPLVAGWKNIPLAAEMESVFKVPIWLEHNIRSMALAELWIGAGAGIDHFICLGVRSGTAAGIVRDGQLLRGHHGLAGEIGLVPIRPPAGFSLPQGKAGLQSGRILAQDVISARAIVRDVESCLREGQDSALQIHRDHITLEKVLEADGLGDPVAQAVMDRAIGVLGDLVQQLVLHHNPQRIILTGPLTELGERLPRRLRARLDELEAYPVQELPEIINSQLGPFVGALGAAALAIQQWRPEPVS